MTKSRDSGIDLLRIICVISVIMIHSSMQFISNNQTSIEKLFTYFFYIIPRFSVPCFVMISGAFVLSDVRNKSLKHFYRKTLVKILIPAVLVTFIYFCYDVVRCVALGHISFQIADILMLLKANHPYYHLWYLYMIAGIYLLVPALIWVKEHVTMNMFVIIAIVLFIFSNILSQFVFERGLFSPALYLGYFVAGYIIREKIKLYSINNVPIIGIIMLLYSFVLFESFQMKQNLNQIISPHSYPIVIISLLIFVIFMKVQFSSKLNFWVNNSFNVYLIHVMMLESINFIFKKFLNEDDNMYIYLIVLGLCTFFMSYFFSYIVQRIYNKSKKICMHVLGVNNVQQ